MTPTPSHVATDELIETLERLEKEATPGPWHTQEYGDYDAPALVVHSSDENRVCFMATPGSHGDPAKIAADASAIVSLRNHLPALISALKENKRLRLRNHLPALISALKENKRLREALEAIPELIADQADHDVLAVVWTALQPQGEK